MNTNLITLASYEIVLSLIMGLFTIMITLILTQKIVIKKSLDKLLLERNLSIGIFLGSIVFGVLANVNGSIEPAVNLLQTKMMGQGGFSFSIFASSLLQFLLFYLIAFLITFFLLFSTLKVGFYLTKGINEIQEIINGNMAITIALAFYIIGFCYFVRPATKNFIGSLVNYELVKADLE